MVSCYKQPKKPSILLKTPLLWGLQSEPHTIGRKGPAGGYGFAGLSDPNIGSEMGSLRQCEREEGGHLVAEMNGTLLVTLY